MPGITGNNKTFAEFATAVKELTARAEEIIDPILIQYGVEVTPETLQSVLKKLPEVILESHPDLDPGEVAEMVSMYGVKICSKFIKEKRQKGKS